MLRTLTVIASHDMRVLAVNQPLQELIGIPLQEIVGKDWKLIFGSNPPTAPNSIDTWLFGNGKRVDVRLTRLSHGDILVITGSLTDSPLESIEERYKSIVDDSPNLISRCLPNGNHTFVNKAYCEYFGKTAQELFKMSVHDLVPEEERPGLLNHFARLSKDQPALTYENRVIRPDGSTEWMQWTNRAIFDARGNIFEYQSVGADISAIKAVEEDLRRSLSVLEGTLESTADGILVVDEDGNVTNFNRMFLRMCNISEEAAAAKDSEQILNTMLEQVAEPRSFVRSFQALSRQPERESFGTFTFREGKVFEFYSKPQKIGDQVMGRVWSLRDISELKNWENALRASQHKIERLHEVAIRLERAQTEEDVCQITADAAEGILNFISCTVDLVQGDRLFVKAISSGLPSGTSRDMSIYEGLAGKTYRTGKTYWIRDLSKNSEATPVNSSYKSVISVPIGNIGVFQVISNKMNAFSKEDVELAELLISHTTEALKRLRSEERIRFISFHDKLTSLYNRAFFEEELARLNTRRQLPLSIIIGDVNGLKLVNDAFGHQAGDKLLVKIASILQSACRTEDIVARWGGDEFAVLLPNTSERTANEIVRRLKTRCAEEDKEQIPISISVGVATKRRTSEDMYHKIREAEETMYRNKLLESKSVRSVIIASLEKTLLEKSNETEEHASRLKKMALQLGEALRLSGSKLDELILLASLHDIGKIAISEDIIKKPGKLSLHEWEVIRKHPEIGYRIALSSPELASIAEGILSHHEHWDGLGYPRGLKEQEIPIISRAISILDAYDVITSGRPYKKARSQEEALQELQRCAGTQFDPELVALFVKIQTGQGNKGESSDDQAENI